MLRRLFKSEQGFTLVELLVTIAILGTLFGIVTLALNGLAASSDTAIRAAELDQVQTSVDIYLAENYPTTTSVPTRGSAALITSADIGVDAPFAIYLRSMPTAYSYSWDAAGNVTQAP